MQIEVPRPAPPVRWLHLGIALTGVGTTLLGCILPALITTWHLKDDRAGLLLAAQFTGSSFGALLVNTDFFGSILRGYLLLIAGAVSLVFFSGSFQIFLFLVFGLGLGLAMTATSMLVSSLFGEKRGAALSLLNASWATGAVLCPVIASLWISHWRPIYLFPVFAAAIALTIVLIGSNRAAFAVNKNRESPVEIPLRLLKLLLASTALAFLYVGVEVSISGWMMTYVHRIPASGRLWAPIATSGFWIALVCGRALVPIALRRIPEARLLTLSLAIAFLSTLLLLLSHALIAIVCSVILAGLVLGPIFPLCMANVLALTNDSPRTKWIFAIPGLGGAALAWMTGKVSAYDGSLRAGLLVPFCTLGIMIILHWLQPAGSLRMRVIGENPSRGET
jgi:MFS transporter, FHS family, glucose/mannose:H+ symporter